MEEKHRGKKEKYDETRKMVYIQEFGCKEKSCMEVQLSSGFKRNEKRYLILKHVVESLRIERLLSNNERPYRIGEKLSYDAYKR